MKQPEMLLLYKKYEIASDIPNSARSFNKSDPGRRVSVPQATLGGANQRVHRYTSSELVRGACVSVNISVLTRATHYRLFTW